MKGKGYRMYGIGFGDATWDSFRLGEHVRRLELDLTMMSRLQDVM